MLAALHKAKEWKQLAEVPAKPRILGDTLDKRFVTEEHFVALLDTLRDKPDAVWLPNCAAVNYTAADWWSALLVYLWITGMRITATLSLRWEDIDLVQGLAKSRACDNKGRRDSLAVITAAVPLLERIRGFGDLVFPWTNGHGALWATFHRLQATAGIDLVCTRGCDPHTPACSKYGFHDFRRSLATMNVGVASNEALQSQMGHRSFQTTQRYVTYAKAHRPAFAAYLPAGLAEKLRRNTA